MKQKVINISFSKLTEAHIRQDTIMEYKHKESFYKSWGSYKLFIIEVLVYSFFISSRGFCKNVQLDIHQ